MTFKTSKLKIFGYLLVSIGFVAACWFALFETDDMVGFERYVFWAALVFFGLCGLSVLGNLFARSKIIEITENGFTYSVYPNQFIQWSDIEAIVPIALPHVIGFRFKTKHHAVLYQQAAKGWFSSKEPKQTLRITISMFADYKEMPSAFLSAFSGEIQERIDDEMEEIYSQKIDEIAEQQNMDPDDVRAFFDQPVGENDSDDVLAGLDAFVKGEAEVTAPAPPVSPADDGQEWWQTASKEFGARVARRRSDARAKQSQENEQAYGGRKTY